jgi:hypothetical protein
MTALAKAIARAFLANSLRINVVNHAMWFVLACLFVAVLKATYGLDLSPGFF